ncbi:MAG: BON domain-containing protein [Pyrinomonadaceae bacterium]
MYKILGALVLVAAPFALSQGVTAQTSSGVSETRIAREIRHELVTLPYYDVFDWLEGEVRADGTVVLRGQVVRPTTKSDAEARARDVEGVTSVVNEIEVLPLSPNDDRLRRSLYRTLFSSNSPLFRYATRAVPPIHIIVNRGRATLKGVVATEGESRIAYARARGVPGLFEVKNELQVESRRAR